MQKISQSHCGLRCYHLFPLLKDVESNGNTSDVGFSCTDLQLISSERQCFISVSSKYKFCELHVKRYPSSGVYSDVILD